MTYARGMEDVMLAAAAVGGVIAALLGAWECGADPADARQSCRCAPSLGWWAAALWAMGQLAHHLSR